MDAKIAEEEKLTGNKNDITNANDKPIHMNEVYESVGSYGLYQMIQFAIMTLMSVSMAANSVAGYMSLGMHIYIFHRVVFTAQNSHKTTSESNNL
jgi:hypothetical protein